MAIRCDALNCRFNRAGWCDSDYIEVDENRVCQYFEGVTE